MSKKEKLTNKQTSAAGINREDNGQNNFEAEKVKQRKKDNVIPRP